MSDFPYTLICQITNSNYSRQNSHPDIDNNYWWCYYYHFFFYR